MYLNNLKIIFVFVTFIIEILSFPIKDKEDDVFGEDRDTFSTNVINFLMDTYSKNSFYRDEKNIFYEFKDNEYNNNNNYVEYEYEDYYYRPQEDMEFSEEEKQFMENYLQKCKENKYEKSEFCEITDEKAYDFESYVKYDTKNNQWPWERHMISL
ncbi:hypothetical protein H8356DRAFT_1695506 [Neocallimastix lanati (nom. inval.)]|jgi:hypothetical protein|uniref:Uncharacterized protein n=1 Tax=Neocallimastix californiae TaxID=1754190 RepID=A0A1Y2EGW1_9FUNG|nr:hypothetical protein H8356DRAFT_1695506 [Neocallimastix sp. JGI-2020a]ORY70812.1 hypothetical protein LY90DRAFT_700085 [Neocallimastix californiae]|eukprot:ORY70812.1 hypothetical protein LY90DRAFT_700085 [Neocallimastix californiae]